jgi:hypothetical protein
LARLRIAGYALPKFTVLPFVILTFACQSSNGSNGSSQGDTDIFAFSACDQIAHPARLTHHATVGQWDHCEDEVPAHVKVVTNWGTKPEWLTSSSFVFVSNLMGDIYWMDLRTAEIRNLTGHFVHAGFTRVHVLANGDLLLLGLLDGPEPPDDPLVAYSEGMFESELYVLKKPYDGPPYPLDEPGWEGIAVSRSSMRIAWSRTRGPFWVNDENGEFQLFPSGILYLMEPSELVTGIIDYGADGAPYIEDLRVVLTKRDVGPVLLEAQDLIGENDDTLLASAYGPLQNGGDALTIDMSEGSFERLVTPFGNPYDEWEGASHDGSRAFVEIDPDAFLLPVAVDLYIYDFADRSFKQIHSVEVGPSHIAAFPHEPVFSEDGRWALTTTAGIGGWPGYGAGILIIDLEGVSEITALPFE